ncbi:MAG: SDR family NAD(P)-dependent oxidoreductase [Oscillospiraceae bacterium]|nr:SDR family NAD(P)-dependent oxidoreductase [Oscillospiraceae bacterium]
MDYNRETAALIAPAVRALAAPDGYCVFAPGDGYDPSQAVVMVSSELEDIYAELQTKIAAYKSRNNRPPEIVAADGGGYYICKKSRSGRMGGKVAVVTGSAQGFGLGIAEELLQNGANVVLADYNFELACEKQAELETRFGEQSATAIRVDVSDEQSVREMIEYAALQYGGLDIFVNNAGIVRSGGLDELSAEAFDLVTKVNYNAYFYCVKYASQIMKIQNRFTPGAWTDIIQINSKSGLEGSKRNFAYAGSKFGGIGLTQSFALELVEYHIKVNSVCPGNFLGGPLWCDPENGLFVQYLRAGKVPGAKTVEDVRRFYEAKVPMGRGCEVADVMKAIYYIVEQQYETGQAIPVTGGQVMLK